MHEKAREASLTHSDNLSDDGGLHLLIAPNGSKLGRSIA